MGFARVEMRYTSVLKDYKDTDRTRYYKELRAYTELDWATPKLLCHNEYWIEVERLTPILSMTREQSRKYREPLRELLQAIHDAGWWHCDCTLTNVVVHPVRGPLLIDWENLTPANGPVSYDLYGAKAAGHPQAWPDDSDGNGVWWGRGRETDPGRYWGEGQR